MPLALDDRRLTLERQHDREHRAAARTPGRGERAPVRFDDAAADRQAEPRSRQAGGVRPAVELLEHARLLAGRKARPAIGDLESQARGYQSENASNFGVLFFGTSTYAAEEAIELLKAEGITLDAMRVKAFPFGKEFQDFVNAHEKVFVIEQNRDAQFKSLMMIELGTNPEKLVSLLNYDGMPITADFIFNRIKEKI